MKRRFGETSVLPAQSIEIETNKRGVDRGAAQVVVLIVKYREFSLWMMEKYF